MATKPSTAVAPATGTQVVDREAALRRQIETQQKMLSKITTSAKFISFKGGNIIIDGKAIPGAKTDVIPLTFIGERAYHEGPYDPDVRQSPLCYSYMDPEHIDDDDYVATPHKDVKTPQSKECKTCPWNEWRSASNGKGKACRESIRLGLLANATDLSKQATWFARIPITSVPAFKSYIGELLGYGKPMFSAVTELSVIPDTKTFFKILWTPKKALDAKNLAIADAKAGACDAIISFPYPDFTEEPKAAVKPLKVSKKK